MSRKHSDHISNTILNQAPPTLNIIKEPSVRNPRKKSSIATSAVSHISNIVHQVNNKQSHSQNTETEKQQQCLRAYFRSRQMMTKYPPLLDGFQGPKIDFDDDLETDEKLLNQTNPLWNKLARKVMSPFKDFLSYAKRYSSNNHAQHNKTQIDIQNQLQLPNKSGHRGKSFKYNKRHRPLLDKRGSSESVVEHEPSHKNSSALSRFSRVHQKHGVTFQQNLDVYSHGSRNPDHNYDIMSASDIIDRSQNHSQNDLETYQRRNPSFNFNIPLTVKVDPQVKDRVMASIQKYKERNSPKKIHIETQQSFSQDSKSIGQNDQFNFNQFIENLQIMIRDKSQGSYASTDSPIQLRKQQNQISNPSFLFDRQSTEQSKDENSILKVTDIIRINQTPSLEGNDSQDNSIFLSNQARKNTTPGTKQPNFESFISKNMRSRARPLPNLQNKVLSQTQQQFFNTEIRSLSDFKRCSMAPHIKPLRDFTQSSSSIKTYGIVLPPTFQNSNQSRFTDNIAMNIKSNDNIQQSYDELNLENLRQKQIKTANQEKSRVYSNFSKTQIGVGMLEKILDLNMKDKILRKSEKIENHMLSDKQLRNGYLKKSQEKRLLERGYELRQMKKDKLFQVIGIKQEQDELQRNRLEYLQKAVIEKV